MTATYMHGMGVLQGVQCPEQQRSQRVASKGRATHSGSGRPAKTKTALHVSDRQTVLHKYAQLVYVKPRKRGEGFKTTVSQVSRRLNMLSSQVHSKLQDLKE